MRFNPATESQARTIDQLAAESRAVISRLPQPPLQQRQVWDCTKGGWMEADRVPSAIEGVEPGVSLSRDSLEAIFRLGLQPA